MNPTGIARLGTACASLLLLAACGTGATDDVASVAIVDTPDVPGTVDTPAPAPELAGGTAEPALSPTSAPHTTIAIDAAAVADDQLGTVTYDLPGCPDAERGAVTDKANQRYWLCIDGEAVTDEIPMTTASSNYGLPPIGTYPVFARDENAYGINGEPLERFVAFYTTPKGNRIAFHEVVDQDPATVGDLDQRGASAGCFRVREADSIQVWNFLQLGDPVVVISN